jgi:MFS family permease
VLASASLLGTRTTLVTLCGVQFVDVLGVTSVIAAIPVIVDDLAAPAEMIGLLATTYAAFFGGLLVAGARLGDKYGPRPVLMCGLVLFASTAFVGGGAAQIGQLLFALALQGTAAAVSVPCALQMLLNATPDPAARRHGLAWWSASGAVAGVLGYVVGGVLTEQLTWRAVFAVNAPIGLGLLAAVVILVPGPSPRDRHRRLDVPGAALLTAAVMSLIAGASLIEEASLRVLGMAGIAAGFGFGAGFVVRQRAAEAPLIPAAAFASRNLRTGCLLSFINTATTSSAGVLAMLLLQQQRGASPTEAALTLMPFSLGVIAGSALTGPLAHRFSARRLGSFGLMSVAAGNLLLALTGGIVAGVVAGVLIAGIGLGVAAVAANQIGTDVSNDLAGSATGLLSTAAQLGTALGVAALLTLAATINGFFGTAVAWAVAGVTALLTAVGLGLARRSAYRDSP